MTVFLALMKADNGISTGLLDNVCKVHANKIGLSDDLFFTFVLIRTIAFRYQKRNAM